MGKPSGPVSLAVIFLPMPVALASALGDGDNKTSTSAAYAHRRGTPHDRLLRQANQHQRG